MTKSSQAPSVEMVDRVAAAIADTPNLVMRVNKARGDGLIHEICWPAPELIVIAAYRDHEEAFIRIQQLQHRAWARAGILAMREPTKAMIEASNREWDGRMSHRSSGAWQAMIDAALSPPDIGSTPGETSDG